jgi:NAD(P)-dependent dehydrogenase (short-subunit alcohol dehydrogenase family)
MLSGKKIIVTGATSGIGQAITVRCAREGADVAFCGADAAGSDDTHTATVAHLLSDDKCFIGGVEIRIDGGINNLIKTPDSWQQS